MRLLTFDIFGTVIDWRAGLPAGVDFDAVVDRQGELEREGYRPYAEIVAQSLVDEAGYAADEAAQVGASAGAWPLFADSRDALWTLQSIAPCAAITNSDVTHREQVMAQLGFGLQGWICAEEVRAYKPDVALWHAASRRMGVPFSKEWWHVSAYADYDLGVAKSLGLTCVFVQRPHSRPGPADLVVRDLADLAEHAAHLGGGGRG